MGRLARPALLEAVNADPNPEVRSRCSALLPKATAQELKARLDTFLADADGRYEHDLPGWNQFRAAVRNEWVVLGHPVWSDTSLDKPAREVFAELLATPANRAVVMAVGGSPHDLGQVVAARRQELYNAKYGRTVVPGGGLVMNTAARREPAVADLAALLFAESQVPAKFVPRTTGSVAVLVTASGFGSAAQAGDDRRKVYRAVAAAWLDTRAEPADMSNAMTVAANLGMPDHACRIATRLLVTPGGPAFYRANAATTLARHGTTAHLPLLEKVMADNAVLITIRRAVPGGAGNNPEVIEIQTRDVALAVAVILSGQKVDDYGFVDQFPGNGTNYSYTRFYFPDDARRKAALDKWNEWRAKNP
jgi:hypothetical protein